MEEHCNQSVLAHKLSPYGVDLEVSERAADTSMFGRLSGLHALSTQYNTQLPTCFHVLYVSVWNASGDITLFSQRVGIQDSCSPLPHLCYVPAVINQHTHTPRTPLLPPSRYTSYNLSIYRALQKM